MRSRPLALGFLGIAATALVAALPAAGKEGVKATLGTSIPLGAPAGAQLRVAWTLASVDEHGKRHLFGAGGVFVRLSSASGAKAETGFARGGGDYTATVRVPKGGIGDVEIGLLSWTNGPSGTRESDMLFPITNDPMPGPARVARPASTTWIFVLVACSLSTLAVLAVVLVRRRSRRSPRPRASSAYAGSPRR
jgi:hypothetical protein